MNQYQTRIIQAAMPLAAKLGFRKVPRVEIAKATGLVQGTISYHFKSMRALQDALVYHAVQTENLSVIAQALIEKHPFALAAPLLLRRKAAQLLTA